MRSGTEGGRIDLHQAFLRVQEQMLANLNASRVYDHYATCGAVSERQWIELLHRYLTERYRATSAFVVDSRGARSRLIDIAIYDRFYSPLLFPDDVQPYIPAESVHASMLPYLEGEKTLDLGCSLRQGTFEMGAAATVRYSLPGQTLIFFLLRLLSRLQQMGTAPPLDLDEYARSGRVGCRAPDESSC